MLLTKYEILKGLSDLLNEDEGGGESTGGLDSSDNVSGSNTLSVLGATNSPNFGGYWTKLFLINRGGKLKKSKNKKRKLSNTPPFTEPIKEVDCGCDEYINNVAKATGKTPEYINKILK